MVRVVALFCCLCKTWFLCSHMSQAINQSLLNRATTMTPDVAERIPSQQSIAAWILSQMALEWLSDIIHCSKSVSSTNANPKNLTSVPDIGVPNSRPKPCSRRILRSGIPTMAQIAGPALLPCPIPWIGIKQTWPPYEALESPYPVLTQWTTFWRVVNIQPTAQGGIPILCMAIEVVCAQSNHNTI
jgi:hypothetical protein